MTEIKYGLVVQKFHNLKPKSKNHPLTYFFLLIFFFLFKVEVGITFGLSPEKRCVL